MSKELSPLVIYQIFKGKYLAKYKLSTGEALTYDAKCISLYSLLGYILFYCYYTGERPRLWRGLKTTYRLHIRIKLKIIKIS